MSSLLGGLASGTVTTPAGASTAARRGRQLKRRQLEAEGRREHETDDRNV